MNEAYERVVRAGIRQAPIEQRIAEIASGVPRKLRLKPALPERPQKRLRRHRCLQYALPRKVERLSGPDKASMILPWAAHIDGARLDFEAGRPLRDAEMQNCVRPHLGGRLARDPPRIGPDDRNDPCKMLDARS